MSLPMGFRMRDHWLVTQEKAPVDGSWTSVESLRSFEDVLERWRARPDIYGIAYAFQADGPFVGVDFDDVRDPNTGEVDPEVKEALSQLQSFTEISSSGTGFHVLLTGEDPAEKQRKASIGTGHVEIYDRSRYFVLTGDRYRPDRFPENAKPADSGFQWLLGEYLEASQSRDESTSTSSDTDYQSSIDGEAKSYEGADIEAGSSSATPAEIRATGMCFDPDFAKLWNGKSVHGCNDDSELDAKLVSRLVFYCKGDEQLIDRCFRQSARYDCRPEQAQAKWDERHTGSGLTYGKHLINEMKQRNPDRFSGTYVNPQ